MACMGGSKQLRIQNQFAAAEDEILAGPNARSGIICITEDEFALGGQSKITRGRLKIYSSSA